MSLPNRTLPVSSLGWSAVWCGMVEVLKRSNESILLWILLLCALSAGYGRKDFVALLTASAMISSHRCLQSNVAAAPAWVGGIASRGFCDAPSLTARTTSATVRCVNSASGDEEQQNVGSAKVSGRRELLNVAIGLGSAVLVGTASAVTKNKPPPNSPFDEKRLLDQNKRMQKLNNAPAGFPGFIREGFEVKVLTGEQYITAESGLIYLDLVEGTGEQPKDGQQVKFHYIGYNENGRRVDSSYQQGQPARTRLGVKGMIPGFEEGIKTMRPGGKRRMVIPPELGPPVGPSTFFSAKQFEVFDVELLEVKDCVRRTLAFYSDVVCE